MIESPSPSKVLKQDKKEQMLQKVRSQIVAKTQPDSRETGQLLDKIIGMEPGKLQLLNCSGLDYLVGSLASTGSQASELGKAIKIINEALSNRKTTFDTIDKDLKYVNSNCTIFLGCTSNMISSGIRESLAFLMRNRMIDCMVTSCGAIEEDIIKCMQQYFVGRFDHDGSMLRKNHLARIGNMLVSENGYCSFEDLIIPILDVLLVEQINENRPVIISEFIKKLGEVVDDESSICYWSFKNDIPIFCPGIVDGAIGDMVFTHSLRSKAHLYDACPNLENMVQAGNDYVIFDQTHDLIQLSKMSINAEKKAAVILGGSLPKHHILNASLLGGGADYAVYLTTAVEYDSSDSGGNVQEAISWGKINSNGKAVKVYGDA
ncbi:MAG: Deoxyhypusine synthase, partial [Paramarteilia canceri]